VIAAGIWLFVAAAIAATWLEAIRRDPEDAPGGGTAAVVVGALHWPLVVVLLFIALLVTTIAPLDGEP
jgi:preprotein translocase subunit SecY